MSCWIDLVNSILCTWNKKKKDKPEWKERRLGKKKTKHSVNLVFLVNEFSSS